MNRLNKPNPARIEYFDAAKKNKVLLDEILEVLNEQVEMAEKESRIHYGHVGDMTHLTSKLTDIRDSLTGRGEYA